MFMSYISRHSEYTECFYIIESNYIIESKGLNMFIKLFRDSLSILFEVNDCVIFYHICVTELLKYTHTNSAIHTCTQNFIHIQFR